MPTTAFSITTSTSSRKSLNQKSFGSAKRSRRYAIRYEDLGEYIPQSYLCDAYLIFLAMANPYTRTSVASMEMIAAKWGVKVRAAQDRMNRFEALGVIKRDNRKNGCRSNLTNLYTFPVLDEKFLRPGLRGDGAVDCTVKQSINLKQTKTKTPPTPRWGVEVPTVSDVILEPQRPSVDPEVHDALAQARELRALRKAERRQKRYERGRKERSARRSAKQTPVQQAVRHIMVVLRVCPGLWGTRSAIQSSVERWMKEYGQSAEHAANGLIARWKDYDRWRNYLEYPCGMMTWFGTWRWLEKIDRYVLRRMNQATEASIGSYIPKPHVDAEKLREKMSSLLGGFDGEEGTFEGDAEEDQSREAGTDTQQVDRERQVDTETLRRGE